MKRLQRVGDIFSARKQQGVANVKMVAPLNFYYNFTKATTLFLFLVLAKSKIENWMRAGGHYGIINKQVIVMLVLG